MNIFKWEKYIDYIEYLIKQLITLQYNTLHCSHRNRCHLTSREFSASPPKISQPCRGKNVSKRSSPLIFSYWHLDRPWHCLSSSRPSQEWLKFALSITGGIFTVGLQGKWEFTILHITISLQSPQLVFHQNVSMFRIIWTKASCVEVRWWRRMCMFLPLRCGWCWWIWETQLIIINITFTDNGFYFILFHFVLERCLQQTKEMANRIGQ